MITLTILAESNCCPAWYSQLMPVRVSATASPTATDPRNAALMPRDIRDARGS